jgi:hypothetical protein
MWSVCYILECPFQFCNADTDVGVRSGPPEAMGGRVTAGLDHPARPPRAAVDHRPTTDRPHDRSTSTEEDRPWRATA